MCYCLSVRGRAEASKGSLQALINSERMYDREPVHQGGPPGRGASETGTGIGLDFLKLYICESLSMPIIFVVYCLLWCCLFIIGVKAVAKIQDLGSACWFRFHFWRQKYSSLENGCQAVSETSLDCLVL